MPQPQAIVFAILGGALLLFAWGRWRYDLVAVLALIAVAATGVLPMEQAFAGFAHPAVVTVAAVLIISRALQNAGVVDALIRVIAPLQGRENVQIAAQTTATAALSAAMNNVGALALMLPVAMRNAYRDGYAPAKSLMPLAFGSLLGGLVTLIGTPPNIIISTFRARELGEPYSMFDFAPVGGAVAAAGLAFVILIGWRLIPKDRRAVGDSEPFNIGDYLLEGRIVENSRSAGKTIRELDALGEDEVRVVGLARGDKHMRMVPRNDEVAGVGDVLLLQGEPEALKGYVARAELELIGADKLAAALKDVALMEVIVKPGSPMSGRTPSSMRLRTVYGVNLLGLARYGRRMQTRLRDLRFQDGDVLMLQGGKDDLETAVAELGLLPLALRQLGIGRPRRLILSMTIFAAAIAITIANWLPIHIAFVSAVAALVLLRIVRLDEVYDAVDWPVIVLLGAMIPVGAAVEATGGADTVATAILDISEGVPAVWVLTLLLVATMMLSDVINNNATAVLMAPIAITLAQRLGASPDPFLMAVAIGASCAFLTPIGHQSNTLVLAPGGYKFGDYWRMGLPLEIVIAVVAIPLILIVWPL